MGKKSLFVACLVLGMSGSLSQADTGSGFRLIVNASNPYDSLSRAQISRMFLKKVTRWENGNPVQPVDLSTSSQVRGQFSKAIHGRSTSAVNAYWQQQIFSGRAISPPEKANDNDVIAFVQSNANGIGYVSAAAPLTGSVKLLTVHE